MERRSAASLRQELELCGALRNDATSRFEQPIEARIQTRITSGGVTREHEVPVQSLIHALRFTVEPEEQQLGARFRQMKEREQIELQLDVFGVRCLGEECGFTSWSLFANRCDCLLYTSPSPRDS